MKRLLASAVMALGIHAALLGLKIENLRPSVALRRAHPVMTVTLSAQTPRLQEKNALDKKPEAPPEPSARVKTEKKKPPKPRQPEVEPAQRPSPRTQPAQKPPEPSIPEPAFDAAESRTDAPSVQGQEHPEAKRKDRGDMPAGPAVRLANPLYRKNPPPLYPSTARRRGLQGEVLLEVLVDRNGAVEDLRVLTSSGHPVLDRAAVRSVRKWSFVPAKRGNETVKMWVRVPIRFELH